MRQNENINVNSMLILFLSNTKQMMSVLQCTFSLKRIFYRTVKAVVFIKNKRPGYSVEREYGEST